MSDLQPPTSKIISGRLVELEFTSRESQESKITCSGNGEGHSKLHFLVEPVLLCRTQDSDKRIWILVDSNTTGHSGSGQGKRMRDGKINQLESTNEIVEYINYVELNQILISEQPYVDNYTTEFFLTMIKKQKT